MGHVWHELILVIGGSYTLRIFIDVGVSFRDHHHSKPVFLNYSRDDKLELFMSIN